MDRGDYLSVEWISLVFIGVKLSGNEGSSGGIQRPLQESGNASELWDGCHDSGKRSLFLLISLCSTEGELGLGFE